MRFFFTFGNTIFSENLINVKFRDFFFHRIKKLVFSSCMQEVKLGFVLCIGSWMNCFEDFGMQNYNFMDILETKKSFYWQPSFHFILFKFIYNFFPSEKII